MKQEIENKINEAEDLIKLSLSPKHKVSLGIKLKIDGVLPKYLKVYTEGDKRGVVTVSNDKVSFIETDIKYSRLFDWVYKHISGNDHEHWMLFELQELSGFIEHCTK